jgi:hypothetical protein
MPNVFSQLFPILLKRLNDLMRPLLTLDLGNLSEDVYRSRVQGQGQICLKTQLGTPQIHAVRI